MQPPPSDDRHYRQAPPLPPEPRVSAVDALGFAFGLLRKDTGSALLALVFFLIPIAGPIALKGWHAEIFQRLHRRDPQPEARLSFDDFTTLLSRGVASFVVQFAYGVAISFLLVIPLGMVFGMAASMRLRGEALGLLLLLLVVVVALASLVGSVFVSAGLTRAELSEDVGVSLQLGALLSYVRRTWQTTLAATIVLALLSVGVAVVGILLCGIGLYLAVALLQVAAVHLRWQIYERHLWEGGEPVAPARRGSPPGG